VFFNNINKGIYSKNGGISEWTTILNVTITYLDLTALFSFVYLKKSELFKKDQISFNHVLEKYAILFIVYFCDSMN
jgi:hypothetical protein